MTETVPVGIETVYGIAFLAGMVAIAAGLTYAGLLTDPAGTSSSNTDAEAAD